MNPSRLGLLFLSAAAAAPTLRAQGSFVVSPAPLATLAGDQALLALEPAGSRWQQIHGDLVGVPRTIRSLRLRRDELVPVLPGATVQPITLEVWMGEVDLDTATADFAQNLGPNAVQVLPPSSVLLPDWVAPTQGAFDLAIDFVVPFAYTGNQALVVEVRTVAGGTNHIADSYAEAGNEVAPLELGQGCSAGFLPYIQNSGVRSFQAFPLQPSLEWSLSAFSAPAGLPGFFLVGGQIAPVTVPGLCTTVWPSLDFVVPAVQTLLGPLAVNLAPPIVTPFVPALVGTSVTVQALSIDPSGVPSPFLLSQGQRLTVPALPANPLPVVSLRGDIGDPIGSAPGYGGRVVEFEF